MVFIDILIGAQPKINFYKYKRLPMNAENIIFNFIKKSCFTLWRSILSDNSKLNNTKKLKKFKKM